MKTYKAKLQTVGGIKKQITGNFIVGTITIQAVFYSSINPARKIHLYDKDGDEFIFPIPGQADPKVTTPELPITIDLPISYMDEDINGANTLIVWGKIESDVRIKSSFSP